MGKFWRDLQGTSNCRPDDCTNGPDKGHHSVCSWLVFRLLYKLANHGLNDPNVTICTNVSHPKTGNVMLIHILSNPPTALPAKATQKLVAKPTMSKDSIVPVQPINRTGFRPIRSERPPQNMPVMLSARAKAEMKIPHHREASCLPPTWKSFTMTHA